MKNALLVAALLVACKSPASVAEPSIAPRAIERRAAMTDESYFPLVEGAAYDYDAEFGDKKGHDRRFVRKAKLDFGEVYYFIDEDDEAGDEPSIGANAFGMGAYRRTETGIETADAFFRSDLPKLAPERFQLLLAFPVINGASTTLRGGDLVTTVASTERVTVPAGTFECLKLSQRAESKDATVWLARGIGTIKRVYVTGRTEVLTAFRFP